MAQTTKPPSRGYLPHKNPSNRCQRVLECGRTCGGRPHIPHALFCKYHASGGKGPAPARAEADAPGQTPAAAPIAGIPDAAAAAFGHELGAFARQVAGEERQAAVQAVIAEDAAREERVCAAARAKATAGFTSASGVTYPGTMTPARRRELLSASGTGRTILAREDAATRRAQG